MLATPLADPGGAAGARPPNRINFFRFCIRFRQKVYALEVGTPNGLVPPQWEILDPPLYPIHRGTKGILLFSQMTRRLQSRGVVTLFHLFTIAIYGRNCFDMQH